MERSTAKTMDCYVEFESTTNAEETVNRINRIYETGRPPRLGNRHVDVELSNQDALLKDLFPRAKCVVWENGLPIAMSNTDPCSTGFAGFLTSEEIVGAIRHAEIPHRSPFCAKCPQRTYESTVSTLYKFPWYAIKLYTVHERNQLFELINRHILSLVSRMKRANTIGLDNRLLRELLYAGLNCPAFNERQKYTLCINSEDMSEIVRFPEAGKWHPFDSLVRIPFFSSMTNLYYSQLISRGTLPDEEVPGLPNNFPFANVDLYSQAPYGPIWFEWEAETAKDMPWEDAVRQEMIILCNLVLSGWVAREKEQVFASKAEQPSSLDNRAAQMYESLHSTSTSQSSALTDSTSRVDVFVTPTRRASMAANNDSPFANSASWNQRFLLNPSAKARGGFQGHRITQSTPTCLPSSEQK
ncbi:uncharacterized protein LDX57_009256 [Aspergillus melleus]|uniref:uncharacterized protein n=1 Tax=Aspergillus melleus TaxID=138277 RepID=UPI001E8DC8B4|nr:uncharacterized protein LDX57_009256 [Aspergillus melleus]KAH8431598.1 hypothetical protein LDX57_009256 [Aspergillus melleus]